MAQHPIELLTNPFYVIYIRVLVLGQIFEVYGVFRIQTCFQNCFKVCPENSRDQIVDRPNPPSKTLFLVVKYFGSSQSFGVHEDFPICRIPFQ